jgi:hypothetical protein
VSVQGLVANHRHVQVDKKPTAMTGHPVMEGMRRVLHFHLLSFLLALLSSSELLLCRFFTLPVH